MTRLRPLAAAALLLPAAALADRAETLESIDVTADRAATAAVTAEELADPAPDTAAALARLPGGGVNRNGPLTGIAQYRGLYGDRLNVLVDGASPVSGGPNAMDTPLSYLPAARLARIEIHRGIAPVSDGIETLGGTVRATSRAGRFANGDGVELYGDAAAGLRSADDGRSVTGLAGVAGRHHRAHAAVTRERGDDRETDAGTVAASRYERDVYELGYGHREGDRRASLDYRRNETGPTGTPALPMDIDVIDTDLLRAGYATSFRGIGLSADVAYNDVHHRMSNDSLRPAANPMMRRQTVAEADGGSYRLRAAIPLATGHLAVGLDGRLARHDADIFAPDNDAFFVRNFNDARRDLHSLFGEWSGPLSARLGATLGLRYTRAETDAGRVDGTPAMTMPAAATLRDRFNAADRERSDDNLDLALVLEYALREDLDLTAGLGRKTRTPSYQERYLWLPLQATGGLADGNNYVGDIDLDPEVAHEATLGLDWHPGRFRVSPQAFYRRVDDYIQGVPATDPAVLMASGMTGDPTPLRFANVDAEFYGIDALWSVQLADRWFLDGSLAYVRGERRDIGDDLYRVAPPDARVALSHRRARWSVTLTGEAHDGQDHVSATNGETESSGYGLLHVSGRYEFPRHGLTLSAGVDNLLDKAYRPHLAGINRVVDSDIAVGERLPGDGINGYVRLSLAW